MKRFVSVLTIGLIFLIFNSSFAIAEGTSAATHFLKRAAEDKRKGRETMTQFGQDAALLELQHRQDLELQQKQFDHEKETQTQTQTVSRDFFDHHTRCLGALVKRHPDMFDDEGAYLADSPKGRIWERVAMAHPEFAGQNAGLCMAMEEMERILRDEH